MRPEVVSIFQIARRARRLLCHGAIRPFPFNPFDPFSLLFSSTQPSHHYGTTTFSWAFASNRFTKSRAAPGTPLGSCRKNARVV